MLESGRTLTVPVVEPVPARARMLARAQRLTLLALLALLARAVGASWAAGVVADAETGSSLSPTSSCSACWRWRPSPSLGAAPGSSRASLGQQDRMLRTVVHEVRAPLGRLAGRRRRGSQRRAPGRRGARRGRGGGRGRHRVHQRPHRSRPGVLGRARRPAGTGAAGRRRRRPAAGRRRSRVLSVVPEPGPGEVVGSPSVARLALANLIRNAAQHALSGRSRGDPGGRRRARHRRPRRRPRRRPLAGWSASPAPTPRACPTGHAGLRAHHRRLGRRAPRRCSSGWRTGPVTASRPGSTCRS